MHDTAYMTSKAIHMNDSLSRASPLSDGGHLSLTPPGSTYGVHDMTQPYTTAAPYSPYAVPAYDSSILTPISVAASPSISERSHRMPSTYSSHEGDPGRLSPPTASQSWSYPSIMTNGSSPSITVPPNTAGMLVMNSFESSHSPEPSHLHWGAYGFSSHDPTEDMPSSLSSHCIYPTMSPSALVGSSPYVLPSTTQIPLASGLPGVSGPLPHTDSRLLMPGNMQQFDNLNGISFEVTQPYRARKHSRARPTRTARQLKRSGEAYQSPSKNSGVTCTADSMRTSTSDAPPTHLTLDDRAPEDSRYLVEMRCRLSDDKGKGMWEHIQQAYKERFGKKTKENLQMQLIRSVQSYAVWPEEEDQALREAVEEYERRRYPEIRKIMKAKGGRRIWDWNDGSIAKRLVQMGVDEIDDQDPVKKTRRKRKSTVRQKSGGEPWVGCVNIRYNSQPRELTAEEDEILMNAFCKPEPVSPQPEVIDPMLTSGAYESGNPTGHQSARLAKHACEQMITRSNEHGYGGHNRYMS